MKVFLFLACLILSVSASALQSHSASSDESFWGKQHFFNLIADYWTYDEPSSPAIKDSGLLYGLSYAYKNNISMVYLEANMEYLTGVTKYDGSDSTGAAVSFDQHNQIYMGQFWLGIQAPLDSVKIIPKIGFLYRLLRDADDPGSGGDYRRHQEYYTLPIGIDVLLPLSTGKLALSGFVTAYFKGNNKTFFTDIGGSVDANFKQSSGAGLEFDATYLLDFWSFGAFVRSWKVDQSSIVNVTLPGAGLGGYIEPDNKTFSIGVRAGVSF